MGEPEGGGDSDMNLRRVIIAAVAFLAACTPAGPPLDPTISGMQAREFFGSEARGSADEPEVIGFYSNGCVAGAQALPETGPTWQAMRLSRNRNWGHPELIDYVTGSAGRWPPPPRGTAFTWAT
jgi:penicillin-insensitive murein endopeptidase